MGGRPAGRGNQAQPPVLELAVASMKLFDPLASSNYSFGGEGPRKAYILASSLRWEVSKLLPLVGIGSTNSLDRALDSWGIQPGKLKVGALV